MVDLSIAMLVYQRVSKNGRFMMENYENPVICFMDLRVPPDFPWKPPWVIGHFEYRHRDPVVNVKSQAKRHHLRLNG